MRVLPGGYQEHYRPVRKGWVNRHTPKLGPNGVRVRPLVVGSPSDIRISPIKTSSADTGLASHLLVFKHRKPVYVFDHHCFSLYGWMEMVTTGYLIPPATLVRVDTHSDGLPNPNLLRGTRLDEILSELYSPPLANASFLEPAVRMRIFNRVIWLKNGSDDPTCPKTMTNLERLARKYPACRFETYHLAQFKEFLAALAILRPGSYAMDWDLDLFSQTVVDGLQPALRKAAGTTLATSPFYVDQEQARSLAKKVIAAI